MKIICDRVSKDYLVNNKLRRVLDNINVEVKEHDFICIFGPNGCGKTTLLKLIANILLPSSGKIYYSGNNSHPAFVSLIFQEQGIFPWLNVLDNICFGLQMKGIGKKERYKKAEEYLEKMKLTKFIDYYPHQLSVGMKQKINLIRGLLMDSEVMLIDESESGLDAYSRVIMENDVFKIWNDYKKTIVYVTHDIEFALRLAKRIWIMSSPPVRMIKELNIAGYEKTDCELKQKLEYFKKQITDIIQEEAQKIPIL